MAVDTSSGSSTRTQTLSVWLQVEPDAGPAWEEEEGVEEEGGHFAAALAAAAPPQPQPPAAAPGGLAASQAGGGAAAAGALREALAAACGGAHAAAARGAAAAGAGAAAADDVDVDGPLLALARLALPYLGPSPATWAGGPGQGAGQREAVGGGGWDVAAAALAAETHR